jgi:hypothetical protein
MNAPELSLKITSRMIRAGGDPFLQNDFGGSLLYYATSQVERNRPELLELLNKVDKVRSLKDLCLRVIHYRGRCVNIPEWFPKLLLEWDDGLE